MIHVQKKPNRVLPLFSSVTLSSREGTEPCIMNTEKNTCNRAHHLLNIMCFYYYICVNCRSLLWLMKIC